MNRHHQRHGPHHGGGIQPGFGEMPVGSVIAFAGRLGPPLTVPPPTVSGVGDPDNGHLTNPLEAWGWMLCDGRELACGWYPELFAALGFLYTANASDNSPTFRIPDYRGYFLRAAGGDQEINPDAGRRTPPPGPTGVPGDPGSTQRDALEDHRHRYLSGEIAAGNGAQGGVPGTKPDLTSGATDTKVESEGAGTIRVSTETRPISINVHYIIRFTYGLQQPAWAGGRQ